MSIDHQNSNVPVAEVETTSTLPPEATDSQEGGKGKGLKITLIISAIVVVLACLGAAAWYFFGNVFTSEMAGLEYIAVQNEKDGYWSMVDPDGKVLFADEFKNEPTAVVNGVFSVKEGETYTLYSASEKPKVLADGLEAVGAMSDGVVPAVRKGERIILLNDKGKTVATLMPTNGKEIVGTHAIFCNNLLAACNENAEWGYVNTKGELAIQCKYYNVSDFSDDGYAIVAERSKNSKKENRDEYEEFEASQLVYKIINTKGDVVLNVKKGIAVVGGKGVCDGIAIVRDNESGKNGYINLKGEITWFPASVKYVSDFDGELFVFRNDDGEFGIINKEGEIIVRPRYSGIQFLDCNGDLIAKENHREEIKCFLLDRKGEKKETLGSFDEINQIIGHDHFLVKDGTYYHLIDTKGKDVVKNEYYGINLAPFRSYYIISDYFNTEGLVNSLVEKLTENGVGKYKLGQAASSLGLNVNDYTYSTKFRNEELNFKGFRYEAKFEGSTSDYISRWQWETDSYRFNPDSKVNMLQYTIEIGTDLDGVWKQLAKTFAQKLKSKGYKENKEYSNDDRFIYVKGKNAVDFGKNQGNIIMAVSENFYGDNSGGEGVEVVEADEPVVDSEVAY